MTCESRDLTKDLYILNRNYKVSVKPWVSRSPGDPSRVVVNFKGTSRGDTGV